MSNKQKKSGITLIQRPEFFLVVITAFLWLAFLAKIAMQQDAITTPDTSRNKPAGSAQQKTTDPNIRNTGEKNKTQTSLTTGRQPAGAGRNRNRLNKPNDAYIEAIRESLDKAKPTQNRIIRGATNPVMIDKISPDTGNKPTLQIEQLINDKNQLDNLNADYRKALGEKSNRQNTSRK